MQRPRSEVTDRCRKVLADWMAMGHSEAELRALAKGSLPLQPPIKPDPPSKTKPV